MTTMTDTPAVETRTLDVEGATIAYDVRGSLPPADGKPALLLIGQPMTAEGFTSLASHFSDRTVLTYDPRGLGRSTRSDGRNDQTPVQQAEDLHALITHLGVGPVELFGSSGGAVTGLALVTAHPEDVATLVRSEEHTSELQSRQYLVCRLLLEKKKIINKVSLSRHLRFHCQEQPRPCVAHIGRAHVCTSVTPISRIPSSA